MPIRRVRVPKACRPNITNQIIAPHFHRIAEKLPEREIPFPNEFLWMVLKDNVIGEKGSLVRRYRWCHNFEPGRIQCLSMRRFMSGRYILAHVVPLVGLPMARSTHCDRDLIKASTTSPLALHFPIIRPDLRSQKLTSPVEY